MMRRWQKGIASVAAVLLLIGIAVVWIDQSCFAHSFYVREYGKLNTADSIGMTEQGLAEATQALLDYLRDKREDLVVSVTIRGTLREVFNEREKQHMEDVKRLYLAARAVGYGALALGGILLIFLMCKNGKDKSGRKAILTGYLRGNGVFFALLAAIGLFAALDFDTFWTTFHKTLFSNDLWLLDPRTDILINMVPEEFFFDLVMGIALGAIGTIGALLLGAWLWRRKLVREEDAYHADAAKVG